MLELQAILEKIRIRLGFTSLADHVVPNEVANDTKRNVQRWQMKAKETRPLHNPKHDRTLIMYGEENAMRARAKLEGWWDVEPSGHYSYETNSIVDALDGDTSIIDNRRSGGGSRGA
jgi:hypothetical protein